MLFFFLLHFARNWGCLNVCYGMLPEQFSAATAAAAATADATAAASDTAAAAGQ